MVLFKNKVMNEVKPLIIGDENKKDTAFSFKGLFLRLGERIITGFYATFRF